MTLTYDQLTLFERILYHDVFDGQDQDDGDRPHFEYGDRVRGQATRGGGIVEGVIVSLGHKYAQLDDLYDGKTIYLDRAELLSPGLSHQKKDAESFDGQDQDTEQSNNHQIDSTLTESKFGEYWVEQQYKTIKGKTYGPYLVQRWRDENGKKRSRYLGKAPKEKTSDA